MEFEPPLPRDTYQLLSRTPLSSALKYTVVYTAAWWRSRGYSGAIESTSTQPGSGASPYVHRCHDNSPASGSRGVVCCLVEGDANRAFFREVVSAKVEPACLRPAGPRPRARGAEGALWPRVPH